MTAYRFLIAIIAFITSLASTSNAEQRTIEQMSNGIAAIAEGEIITVESLRRELAPIIPRLRLDVRNEEEFRKRVDAITKEILQTMIDRIIIVKAAEEKGILIPDSYIEQEYNDVLQNDFGGNRARFLEYLRTQGITSREFRADIRKRVIVNVMRQQNRKSQSEISPERIENFYIKNKPRFYQSEAIHLRQIILSPLADESITPLRQTARLIISELEKGADFRDLAQKYGQDEISRNGGDWGWLERADMRSELSQAAFALSPGGYSQPIELDSTIFILYCEDLREEMIQPISQVRDIIEDVLVGQIARQTQENWLKDLRKKAHVSYFL